MTPTQGEIDGHHQADDKLLRQDKLPGLVPGEEHHIRLESPKIIVQVVPEQSRSVM